MNLQVLVLSLFFSAQAFAGGGSSVGPGNPSALNCIKLGGTLESIETPYGQGANCVIDEWQLWREMISQNLVNENDDPGMITNPASANCYNIGGTIRIVSTSEGEVGYCIIEEWALFRTINIVDNP